MNRLSVDHQLRRELKVEMYPMAKKSAANKESVAFDLSKQLWPKPLSVIGGSGQHESGKTLFGLSICPGPQTRAYDFEDSTAPYESIGFDRVDVPKTMASSGNAFNQEATFMWWWTDILAIEPGQYRVIHVDPITDIENGLVQYVSRRPTEFGYTQAQFNKMEGLKWDCVKTLWKSILLNLMTKIETLYFVAHTKREWIGNSPTANIVPKGKQTLFELASLYLMFDRSAKNGVKPQKPAANVLKQRIVDFSITDGEIDFTPILPPRLPEATPKMIREYMLNPADYSKLKEAEKFIDRMPSESEILALKTNLAETELNTETMRGNRMDLIMRHAPAIAQQATQTLDEVKNENRNEIIATEASSPPGERTHLDAPLAQPAKTNKETVTESLRPSLQFSEGQSAVDYHSVIERFKGKLGFNDDQWTKVLAKRGVGCTPELDQAQGYELCKVLAARIEQMEGGTPGK